LRRYSLAPAAAHDHPRILPAAAASRGAGHIFSALDTLLKSERRRLRDVFDEFDQDGSGQLGPRELGQLARKLLPDATATEVRTCDRRSPPLFSIFFR